MMKRLICGLVPILGTTFFLLAQALQASRMTVVTVTSAADSGAGSLRAALTGVMAGDTITFDPAVFPPGNPTPIFVLSVLPSIGQNNVTIDASNAGVVLDGLQAPAGTNGLILDGDNCLIRGLTIRNFTSNGIYLAATATGCTIGGDKTAGAAANGQGNVIIANGGNGIEVRGSGHTVQGNHIGIDVQGLWDVGNAFNGIAIWQGAQNNTVGGTTSGFSNVISGNGQNGLWLAGTGTNGNLVRGNLIGTRADGLGPVSNDLSGVAIQEGAQNNHIGDALSGAGNVISGNAGNGIYISDAGSSSNQVLGNLIGSNKNGSGVIGQGGNGILVLNGASSNIIGNGTTNGRNVISGNSFDGIRIEGSSTAGNIVRGNYVGSNLSGTAALPNGQHGVEVTSNAHDNVIGGNRLAGEGNLLSGNGNHGLVMTLGAHHNTAAGNLIGPDASGSYSLGNQLFGGIDLADGAHDNLIGGSGVGQGNLISGNQTDGIAIFHSVLGQVTANNQIVANVIGLKLSGNSALPNNGDGIFHVAGAQGTDIISNTISGNTANGVRLSGATSTNGNLAGNRIGTNAAGTAAIGNGQYGVWITESTAGHFLGNNTISGNGQGGVVIQALVSGQPPHDNTLVNNRIGTDQAGTAALGNGGDGIHLLENTYDNTIGPDNRMAFQTGYGVRIEVCNGNQVTQNEIYSNAAGGIAGACLPAPQLAGVTLEGTETITGTTIPLAQVEFFSDDGDQGRLYEGQATADTGGYFSFSPPGGFAGPNVTATSTDANGNTSPFAQPAHIEWTYLLYFNGDNDLEAVMYEALGYVVAAGPSPRANILLLIDDSITGTVGSGTELYDVTRGTATGVSANLGLTNTVPGELNMGDQQTLVDFVNWGRTYYPSRHTLLAIVDHGGGWAPNSSEPFSNTLPIHKTDWLGGVSGLSWDFTSNYDYLDILEIRQAMAAMTDDGADPLDVLFFDVCLMGMVEVAYQIREYAAFFVSAQNIGWAPIGPAGRYVPMVQGLAPAATPQQLAEQIVADYAGSLPPEGHPFTISAVRLADMPAVADSLNQLAVAISQTLPGPGQLFVLQAVYQQTQKLDYDSDLDVEPETDGFVDIYDLALQASQEFSAPAVDTAAQAVLQAMDSAVVAEAHSSGAPWLAPEQVWDLDNVHGLSVFLPLGEDLEFPILITETSPITSGLTITRLVRLRDLYAVSQLEFVQATEWGPLIGAYYELVSSPVPTTTTDGPAGGLLPPDVTPPQTTATVNGPPVLGQTIEVQWTAGDLQSGVQGASLWYRLPGGQWQDTGQLQTGSAGTFTFLLDMCGLNQLAVRATDVVGNLEPPEHGPNTISFTVAPCVVYLPIVP